MHPKNRTGFKTLDRLAADPRVERLELDENGLWCHLLPGHSFDGCSGFRADSAKRLLEDATRIEEGEPC